MWPCLEAAMKEEGLDFAPSLACCAPSQSSAIREILNERDRQDAKFSEQNVPGYTWLAILTEEVGELAQAILHTEFGGKAASGLYMEAVHCAAVGLAIVECLNRHGGAFPLAPLDLSNTPDDYDSEAELLKEWQARDAEIEALSPSCSWDKGDAQCSGAERQAREKWRVLMALQNQNEIARGC